MLNFILEDGQNLDIPAHSILMIEENTDGKKLTNIVYSLQQGENLMDTVKATFGNTKKQWKDANPQLGELLELTIAGEKPHKLAVPENTVVARRGLKEDNDGGKVRLTFNVGGRLVSVKAKDSYDTIVGDS